MKILILTCPKFLALVNPCVKLLDRYWPEHPQVMVHSSQEPVSRWTEGLKQGLVNVNSERVILFLEDYFITAPVDHQAVEAADELLEERTQALKVDLCGERKANAGQFYRPFQDYIPSYELQPSFWLSAPEAPYQMSMCPGIWNTEVLQSFITRARDPWAFEIKTSFGVSAANIEVFTMEPAPIPAWSLMARKDKPRLRIEDLPEKDRDVLEGVKWPS